MFRAMRKEDNSPQGKIVTELHLAFYLANSLSISLPIYLSMYLSLCLEL